MEELTKKAEDDSQKRRGAEGGAAAAWGTMKLYPSTYGGSSNRDAVNLAQKDAIYVRDES